MASAAALMRVRSEVAVKLTRAPAPGVEPNHESQESHESQANQASQANHTHQAGQASLTQGQTALMTGVKVSTDYNM